MYSNLVDKTGVVGIISVGNIDKPMTARHPRRLGIGSTPLSFRPGGPVKIYLGGPMFDLPNVRFNLWFAERLRSEGFKVYCPNENDAINDKTRTDITPEAVYQADVDELMTCNVFLCQVAEDSGTMWEAGFMDCLARHVDPARYARCNFRRAGPATDTAPGSKSRPTLPQSCLPTDLACAQPHR